MTWGSFLTQSFGMFFLLPLVLTRFSAADTSLWFMFNSIAAMQMMFQMGFATTFIRLISYGRGGMTIAELSEMHSDRHECRPLTNEIAWETIESICGTMKKIYQWMAIASFLILFFLGSWAVYGPIEKSSNDSNAWIAWGVVLTISTVSLFLNQYSVYLQGMNKIALLRRRETATGACGIICGFIVLMLDGQLLELIIFTKIWLVIGGLINLWLCCRIYNNRYRLFKLKHVNRVIWRVAWPASWRAGIGVAMSAGVMQLTGVIYAQIGQAAEAASYWLGLRLITALSTFSRAPFYTKIPEMARIWASNDKQALIKLVRLGMLRSNWILVFGFITLGLAGNRLTLLLNSNTPFPGQWLWILLSVSTFFERYSSMHVQLYSTTNKIIWHKVNGIGGSISIIFMLLLLSKIGVYAFPLALIAGQLCFTLWYALHKSYNEFALKFFEIDGQAVVYPLFVFAAYIVMVSLY